MTLNKYIDHTLLKPDASIVQVTALCEEARKYSFASVCVNPINVPLTVQLLKGSDVKTCTVVGFPLGATFSEVKAFEAEAAIKAGAAEIDMVINIRALKEGDLCAVERDIRAVRDVCEGVILKVIIEACLLTDEEKVEACLCAKRAGADFVKTSTGFSVSGAFAHDVELMRRAVGEDMGVKAAGGIRTRRDAEVMINAGATRLGSSAGVAMVLEA